MLQQGQNSPQTIHPVLSKLDVFEPCQNGALLPAVDLQTSQDISCIAAPLRRKFDPSSSLPRGSKNSFLFLHINIQSLRRKLEELQFWLKTSNCGILSVNEHWLPTSEIDLNIPFGYSLASGYCRSTIGHGGVAIYIKNDLNLQYFTIVVTDLCIDTVFEAAAVHIPKHNIIVASAYRTPSSSEDEFIVNLKKILVLLTKPKYKNQRILIFGDINMDSRVQSHTIMAFLDSLRSFDCFCLNDKPIRYNACLDNIISNIHENNVEIGVVKLGVSDHDGL